MRHSTLPWRLFASGLLLRALAVDARPSINVSLKASFGAAPYLVELLETAAIENATSYFPLLDRIADGTFAELNTERELYDRFIRVLQDDGHVRDLEALSAFNFALSLHAAAPRVQAHFQYYNTSVAPGVNAVQDAACPVWVHLDGKQYCSPTLERAQQDVSLKDRGETLPFDRVLGENADGPSSTLYADLTHPLFGHFHETVSRTAKEGRSSYRVRYRPSSLVPDRPLFVNGYGVELWLKRTDYIVIDDREGADSKDEEHKQVVREDVHNETPSDLRPLTASEVSSLGLNAASFIMNSPDPFGTLLKVSADFPKYSSLIAGHNASQDFVEEFKSNRAAFLPQGYNIFWMNGLQVEPRQINAFSLLDQLKRERQLVGHLRGVGLSADEAVKLLAHEVIAQAHVEDEPQRYDWQDKHEDGEVILWLNDIERDKRYENWPTDLTALLQRAYPGQLPPVRRDIHNLVLPIDFAEVKDLTLIVETLQGFVRRTVPLRIGLVPRLAGPLSTTYARLAYHINDTYGLAALIAFLEDVAKSKNLPTAAKQSFAAAISRRELRPERAALTYEDARDALDIRSRIEKVEKYLERLALQGSKPPFLINGVALPRGDNWLDSMSQRITLDLRLVQQGVFQNTFADDIWVPDLFLFQAAERRNALVVPEDPKAIRVHDVSRIMERYQSIFDALPCVPGTEAQLPSERVHVLLIVDLDTEDGQALLREALTSHRTHAESEMVVLHNPGNSQSSTSASVKLYEIGQQEKSTVTEDELETLLDTAVSPHEENADTAQDSVVFWQSAQDIATELGIAPGMNGLWLNGRVLGPVQEEFVAADFDILYRFEQSERIVPVTTAITNLDLEDRFVRPADLAKVTSLIARALVPEVPEGIFESVPSVRMDKFHVWNGTHSSIHLTNSEDPTIRIVAAIDPASEAVQPWIPILKTLSELQGVDVKIYMNPKEKLQELPVKRFFRQVLASAPSFDSSGALVTQQATFAGIPEAALLNLGMVVPPAWLVAPQEANYDLDNIKLSSLPAGQNVDAVYELEHILIEGHSRDVTTGPPPRGVQLFLGSDQNPHFTDTIIMANLGYFQFKANPGYWRISLQPGRSSQIFHIDSIGAKGHAPQPGDETTSVALLSFQGTTLFPRLSRKPGMEEEDVLESASKLGSAKDYLSKGASFLSSVGLGTKALVRSKPNADINIFSVASGHLYERMLNIMILSVMKHTSHTVKFWFIEQFLSPSFKSALPHLARHYHFDYELVTYKWPHWLRGQKEKQREIWGYKILFLDVLFPLSLDKVIFVDADQIVRTDMIDLNRVDLHGAPYGFTPMCDSRTEMEGFRFWKQGYWKTFLQGKPYHISALYVVDLTKFREVAAGDRLRQQYHQLSADPASLSNLDQDLPNHMQHVLPIHSLRQEWLWCETWCDDPSLGAAKTIDLCNNPLTKEPKLERARRQVPEWNVYDAEIADVLQAVTERARAGTAQEGAELGGNGNGNGTGTGTGTGKVRNMDEL